MEVTSLLEKFNKVKTDFIEIQRKSESFEMYSPKIANPEDSYQEYFEQLNNFRDQVNEKENQKFILEQHKEVFFDFFEKQLTSIYTYKNLDEAKENLELLEKFMAENRKTILHSSTPKKKRLVFSNISDTFSNLSKFIDLDLNTKNENDSIIKLKTFTEEIKMFASEIISSTNNNTKENEPPLTNQNSLLGTKRRDQLLSTAYIKKAYSKFGENDLVIPVGKLKDSIIKNKKMLLRNFLQIYLIKENEIFSESYFSKYDHAVLYKYRKYKYYQIKFCFSIQESYQKIEIHLNYVKQFFDQYLLMSRKNKCGNFITFLICGVGKNQCKMKNTLIKYINNEITSDCLIKISLFSNLSDAVGAKIKQCMSNNYHYHTNFKDCLVNKILPEKKKYKKSLI